MKNLFKLLITALVCLSATLTGFTQASLSYQGVVRNLNGTSVENNKYEFTFQLYEEEIGGIPVWTETQPQVEVTGGIYSVVLGEVTPLDVPFDAPYYLGVSFDGGAELTPRTRLTASPYALSLLGEGNVFPNDGNVGVGTTSPEEQLHVVGNLKVDGDIIAAGGLGPDLSNLSQEINTSENISADTIHAEGNMTIGADNLSVIGADEELKMIRGQVGINGTIQNGSGFSVELIENENNYLGLTIPPGRPQNFFQRIYQIIYDEPFGGIAGHSPHVSLRVPNNDSNLFVEGTFYVFDTNASFLRVIYVQDNIGVSTQTTFNFTAIGPR